MTSATNHPSDPRVHESPKAFKKTPIPPDLADRAIDISDNSRTVLEKRYLRRGPDGQPIETEQEMFWRVAYNVALAEETLGGDEAQVDFWARRFFDLLTGIRFFPNSPTFTGAGTPLGQLAACFVLAIDDDMGRTGSGIFETLRHAALIQQTGGGNGFAFSRLRPAGALVRSSSGTATGPVGFLSVYDQAFGEIAQGGCLTPDTLVFTENGLLRLDEIVKHREVGWRAHQLEVSTDEGPRFSNSTYNNGVVPVLRIQTSEGLQLTGTPNHKLKVMSLDGPAWRRFDDIQPGDAIMVKLGQHRGKLQTLRRPEQQHGNQVMPELSPVLNEALAFFAGYLARADMVGSTDGDRIEVSVNRDSYLLDEMPALMRQLFGQHLLVETIQNETSVSFVIDNSAVKDFLVMNGLLADGAVPCLIRQSPPEAVGAFLRGLFEASGAFVEGYPQISHDSERLIREVAVLLIGLGCPVHIRRAEKWQLRVHSSAGLAAWSEMVERKASHTLAFAGSMVQAGHAPSAGSSQPAAKPLDDVWFMTVESVEDAGEALTLDIEVEDNHTYLANGCVSHNSRRGANMAVLRVDHPDIRKFITCKAEEGNISNFNISVGVTDEFMEAVVNDDTFDLRFGGQVYETVQARELFSMIVEYAHHNGEPGVLFLDSANQENPVPNLYELESTNPCVTGDTLVATPSGWRRVDEINVGDEICTVLGTGNVATVETNEAVPVYEIKLSDGGSLRVTAAHQFHARNSDTKFFEPRRLDELNEGDWIRVFKGKIPNNPVPQGNVELEDRDYGFMVGVLIGDECYTPHVLSKNVVRVSSHVDDEEWNQILLSTFKKIGTTEVKTYATAGTRALTMDTKPGRIIADWVKSTPLEPAISHDKFIPESFINSNYDFLVGLLDGLFSTDGSVELASNHPLVRFHTSSKVLAQQVRRILLMFGIHGQINESVRKRHDIDGRVIRHDRPKYDVIISGESFGRFFEQITLSHSDKQYRMEEAALKCNFTGGNWAAKVISIEPVGVETVYDLYEPRSDTWITEGYVSRGCGEQFLGPFENCCLGSINLARHMTDNDKVDWDRLAESVALSTRFLDDVVTANAYVPAIPELREAAERVRRIGLGIMGLADMMYRLGVRYGSVEGQEFASQVMEFVRYHGMKAGIDLSEERGPFLGIEGSRYDPKDLKWTPSVPVVEHKTDWGRPTLDWNAIKQGIQRHGIRNGAQTTIAPTGTIATVSGCEGYGCEPVFALAYQRYVNTNAGNSDERMALQYTSPLFARALRSAGLDQKAIDNIVSQVNETGSCQDVFDVPENIRRVFVTSGDITAEQHVRMQAAMQAHVDNAISKTINFPAAASMNDVAQAYELGWRLGCKGMTVYVTGSREKVVLETKQTREKRGGNDTGTQQADEPREQLPLFNEHKKPRGRRLTGYTYRKETPAGTTYVTINENGQGEGHPFEIFMHTAKAGSETAAVSEALGRLMSYILRLSSPVIPRDRVLEMIRQMRDIGGGRQMGFGPNRVASLPDALAQILQDYIDDTMDEHGEDGEAPAAPAISQQLLLPDSDESVSAEPAKSGGGVRSIGDLCPTCGNATLVREEGCLHCYTCGYSEC
jgi:ribonucleotide reductase alpha subunit